MQFPSVARLALILAAFTLSGINLQITTRRKAYYTVERIVGKRGPNTALRPDFLFDPILLGTGAAEVVCIKKGTKLHRVSEKILQSEDRYQFIAGLHPNTERRRNGPCRKPILPSSTDAKHFTCCCSPSPDLMDGMILKVLNLTAVHHEIPWCKWRTGLTNRRWHLILQVPQTQAPRGRAGSSPLLTTSTLDRRTVPDIRTVYQRSTAQNSRVPLSEQCPPWPRQRAHSLQGPVPRRTRACRQRGWAVSVWGRRRAQEGERGMTRDTGENGAVQQGRHDIHTWGHSVVSTKQFELGLERSGKPVCLIPSDKRAGVQRHVEINKILSNAYETEFCIRSV
ncbi:hypothetical protein K438DRAFT_1780195 [Mycena galopus ATCC 62051]|nr:hypothetical protein K438DRAFT_1780195 [Mycena galopus ATCC 62051]